MDNTMSFYDMIIVEESSFDKVAISIKNIFVKIRHAIKRMLYNLYKLKKISVPKKVDNSIKKLCDICNIIYIDSTHSFARFEFTYSDYKARLDQVMNMEEYNTVFQSNITVGAMIDVPSNSIVTRLKSLDKCVEDREKDLNRFTDKTTDDADYVRFCINIFNLNLKILSKYFTYGNRSNKTELEQPINAEIILDTI